MRTFITMMIAFLTIYQLKAQDKKRVYRLYEKTGKEISKQQLDSLEAIHKVLRFEFLNTPDELLIVVNLMTEEMKAEQKGNFQVQMVQQEDGSYKANIVGEDALREKWVGKNIFEANLKDTDSKRYALGTKGDRVTVLNLWYTACGPCVKEMPDLNELVAEFVNDKVDFLALTFDSEEKVSKFLKKRQFDYQIIPDVQEHLAKVWVRSGDKGETVSTVYPVHIVIDQKGVVQEMILGAKEDIKELLKKAIEAQL